MTFTGTFLVDTNCYVRIARATKCVLGNHAQLELRLLTEIANECSRSARLKNTFPWMLHTEYIEHRNEWILILSRDEIKAVSTSKRELRDAVEDTLEAFAQKRRARGNNSPVLSAPDSALFYTAYALECGIVTDEGPLSAVCKEFDVAHYTTLDLLRHLVDSNMVTLKQVEAAAKHWQYDRDEPRGWKKQYQKLFGEPIPIWALDGS